MDQTKRIVKLGSIKSLESRANGLLGKQDDAEELMNIAAFRTLELADFMSKYREAINVLRPRGMHRTTGVWWVLQ
jgi:hypothetical protein